MSAPKNSNLKLGITITIFVGGIAFTLAQTAPYLKGKQTNTTPFPQGPPMMNASAAGPGGAGPFGANLDGKSFEERREQMRDQMAKQLSLTPEQQAKMQEMFSKGMPSSPEEMRERFKAMGDTLTPEQKEKGRQTIHNRLLNDPNSPIKNLSKEEQDKFLEKLDRKLENGEPPMLMLGPPPGMMGQGMGRP